MEGTAPSISFDTAADRARFVRSEMPSQGLFSGHQWRVSPEPLRLKPEMARELESLGRVFLQFYRAVNLLYRKSAEGKQPEWVARWLDQGKPAELIALQRAPAFKNDVPRVIRPDLLITEHGLSVTELDSVPGGIGLTAWLNQVYAKLPASPEDGPPPTSSWEEPMACCAVSRVSLAKHLACRSSFLRKQPSTGRKWPGWLTRSTAAVSKHGIRHSRILPTAMGYIAFSSCLIYRTSVIPRKFWSWPRTNGFD